MLTREYLDELGFIFNEESPFENIKMKYYCKDSVLLFFNEGEHNKNSFLIGYGDYNFGNYIAVTFRWISTKEQLHEIFKAVKGKELKNKNMEKKTFVEWIIYLKNKKNIDKYFCTKFYYWSLIQKN